MGPFARRWDFTVDSPSTNHLAIWRLVRPSPASSATNQLAWGQQVVGRGLVVRNGRGAGRRCRSCRRCPAQNRGQHERGSADDGFGKSCGAVGTSERRIYWSALDSAVASAIFQLPPTRYSPSWTATLSTVSPDGEPEDAEVATGEEVTIPPRSLLVLSGPQHSPGTLRPFG